MAVRVRLRIRCSGSGKVVDTVALVNSGYETERPELMIPMALARELGLWPPPPTATMIELGTAGGPVRKYLVPNALEVEVIESDRTVGPVRCDAVISHIEEEVLINDKLGEELRIVILGMASGRWRFEDDPPSIVRKSYPPQYWR